MRLDELDPSSAMQLADVADYVGRHTGKRPSPATCSRWVQKGIRGRQLEAVKVGGVYYTTQEKVDAFLRDESFTKPAGIGPTRSRADTFDTAPAGPRQLHGSNANRLSPARSPEAAKRRLDELCSG